MAAAAKKHSRPDEPVIENRKARHNYFVERTLEVGVALRGSEVKSIRAGLASIAEGYVRAEAEPCALTLYGVHIGEYAPARGIHHHPALRSRALLAHKREILKLATESEAKGTTIVPLKMYFKDGRVKLLIGVARGKQHHDRRQDLKQRESDRELQRAMTRKKI